MYVISMNENGCSITMEMRLNQYEFDSMFVRCADCNKLIFKPSAVVLDGKYYCDDCVMMCCSCGRVMRVEDVYHAEDTSEPYCYDCYSSTTYECAGCHNRYRYEDSLIFSDDDDCDYCPDCYKAYDNRIIRSYHTFKDSQEYVFLGSEQKTDTPYIGYELEIDSEKYVDRELIARHVAELMPEDYFHFENDGSLSDSGFEMISQPCSLSYNLALRDKFSELFSYLADNDMLSHDIGSCGYHIHIDRAYFGSKEDSSIAKMLYLFEKFNVELTRFSRRSSRQIEDWARSYKCDDCEKNWITNTVKKKSYYDRYHAVNLTNRNTAITVKQFKGIEVSLYHQHLSDMKAVCLFVVIILFKCDFVDIFRASSTNYFR